MSDLNSSMGVLNGNYAVERKQLALIFRYKTRALIVANAIKHYLDRIHSLTVLDFGSADGRALKELDNHIPIHFALGVEFSGDLIASISELPDTITIIKGDITSLPEKATLNTYDVVSALAVLEHVENPLKAVQEAKRVLRPGGLFVATAPNPFWDRVSSRLGLLKKEQHQMFLGRKELIQLIMNAGMEYVAFDRFMWAPVSVLPYLNIPVSPKLSLSIDTILRRIKIMDWLFVNQCIIARKPSSPF